MTLPDPPTLNETELVIMTLIAQGEKRRVIARQVGYTPRVIYKLAHGVMDRMQARTMVHCVALLVAGGFIVMEAQYAKPATN